jgi:hypothetical protein
MSRNDVSGSYYMVWDAIAAKADRHSGGWRLLDFLRSAAGVRGDGGRERGGAALAGGRMDGRTGPTGRVHSQERYDPRGLHARQRRQTCVLISSWAVTFPISSSPTTGGSR